jgi:hypothetical protein
MRARVCTPPAVSLGQNIVTGWSSTTRGPPRRRPAPACRRRRAGCVAAPSGFRRTSSSVAGRHGDAASPGRCTAAAAPNGSPPSQSRRANCGGGAHWFASQPESTGSSAPLSLTMYSYYTSRKQPRVILWDSLVHPFVGMAMAGKRKQSSPNWHTYVILLYPKQISVTKNKNNFE